MEANVMYIFINSDLKMSSGKIASQACHAVQLVVEEVIRGAYEKYPVSKRYLDYMKWKNNCVKIVLKANEEQMRELIKHEDARYIIDDGLTQVKEDSLTAIAFFPNSTICDVAKDYKLL